MSILTVLLIVVGAIMEDFYFSAKFRGLSEHEKKGFHPWKAHVDPAKKRRIFLSHYFSGNHAYLFSLLSIDANAKPRQSSK